jgi:hypothetical protein
MAKLYNLARVVSSTTGTGTLTLGAAVSGCLTFANAGVKDGDVVSYGISDGSNSEVGIGTYTSSGPTLSRTTVLASTNSGNKISCSGNQQVYVTILAEDITQNDGWIRVKDTWTYASATTITVPSGATAIYSVGDKIKLTQTNAKYFYIIDVADTLLTITAGTSYTLTNATIRDVFYSKLSNPVGFPEYFAYTPSISYAGGTTNPTSLTPDAKFSISGNMVFVICNGTLTRGSGNRSYTVITMPVTVGTVGSGGCHTNFTAAPASGVYVQTSCTIFHGTMITDGVMFLSLFYYL